MNLDTRLLHTVTHVLTESESETKKIPKQVVLYILDQATEYKCGECIYFKTPNRCSVFGPDAEVKAHGGCNFYIQGTRMQGEIPWLGHITKEQAGYVENANGFSCKRCEYFDTKAFKCAKVDETSKGDTPGMIHPNACCNHWEADDDRAKLSTSELRTQISVPSPKR
jgi:hypothetical protein